MILEGKTVVVTGVGGGLGRECAASALRDGANVVLAARTGRHLEATAAELDPSGERVATHVTDITDAESCEALVAAAPSTGSARSTPSSRWRRTRTSGAASTTSKFEAWRKAFETNVLGALTVLRPVATAMKAGGGGLGGAHRLPVHVPARTAPERVRRLEGRAAVGHVLPGRRARPRQHPLQHGGPVVDVGSERRDVRERHGRQPGGHRRGGARGHRGQRSRSVG